MAARDCRSYPRELLGPVCRGRGGWLVQRCPHSGCQPRSPLAALCPRSFCQIATDTGVSQPQTRSPRGRSQCLCGSPSSLTPACAGPKARDRIPDESPWTQACQDPSGAWSLPLAAPPSRRSVTVTSQLLPMPSVGKEGLWGGLGTLDLLFWPAVCLTPRHSCPRW